ncbi:hypothetical protein OFN97_05765 [Campylobacter sp. VBCF_05 NA6]|uniref:hypothetical protein n=1 Tax=unclassified Campylobacter TaxID=2593542 RepID=UPI0022E99C01|nr:MULTISPECIES: hypothetical protein [unclassified Campylobacter]MDA3057147.1 hypothetical protein [Campylobacter sp. VBCF_04 NA7]MDA3059521.1 hypothetical protein [Campylobacter sp. VBCF_05 NA6]
MKNLTKPLLIPLFIGLFGNAADTINPSILKPKANKNNVIQNIFTYDMLGVNIKYLEQFTGIAKKIYDYDGKKIREYQVNNCILSAYVSNNVVRSLELNLSDQCTFNINNISSVFGNMFAHELTFGKIFNKIGEDSVIFATDCFGTCGNLAEPLNYIYYESPRSDNNLQMKFTGYGSEEFDGDINNILDYSNAKEGTDYFIGNKFYFNPQYNKYIHEEFKNIYIDKIHIGYDIFSTTL